MFLVLMRLKSISWATSRDILCVPRVAIRNAADSRPLSFILSTAVWMMAAGVRNSWAMRVKRLMRKSYSCLSIAILRCSRMRSRPFLKSMSPKAPAHNTQIARAHHVAHHGRSITMAMVA